MKARHKKRADGGRTYYDGGNSNVAKEAAEKHQMKRGGAVKDMGKIKGEKAKHRLDKRARGGRVGSDASPMAPGSARNPYSSAAK